MESNGRRVATPAGRLWALVPLTSRAEEDRYWYDPGDPETASLACGAVGVYGFNRFECDDDRIDIVRSGDGLWSGH